MYQIRIKITAIYLWKIHEKQETLIADSMVTKDYKEIYHSNFQTLKLPLLRSELARLGLRDGEESD